MKLFHFLKKNKISLEYLLNIGKINLSLFN
jgi:uncharacterized protein (UPF0333 family)